jgi:hypothetical protein
MLRIAPLASKVKRRAAVPLTRLKDEYLEQNGVRFLMQDEDGNTVPCRVGHEALRDHADRLHLPGTDAEIFEAYRELIERIAAVMHSTPMALLMTMAECLSPLRSSHG